MKWIERADCRPPKTSSSQGQVASMPGDMVRPVRIISGISDEDAEIGELLQDVVVLRRLPLGEVQHGVVLDVLPRCAQAEARGASAADRATKWPLSEDDDGVGQKAEREDPGEGQVPAARQGEIVV